MTVSSVMPVVLQGAMILGFVAVSAMFLVWWERKVSAVIQNRMGPMIVGWHGALQSPADVVKLMRKENIVPSGADKLSWWLAPFFVMVPPIVAFVTIPFGENVIVRDLNVGILFVVSITSICESGRPVHCVATRPTTSPWPWRRATTTRRSSMTSYRRS